MPQMFQPMRMLLIENQPLADRINKACSTDLEIFDVNWFQSAEAIAEEVKTRYAGWMDMYMINVNLKIGNNHLSENIGIKILKLLRLNHIDNHVILYSWLGREMLMGDLRNAIIFSKGISFHRLPEFMSVLPKINYEELSTEKADKTELLQLFRAEYNPDDRHFNANIFGVWQLIRIQDAYERLYDGTIKYSGDDESRKKVNDYLNSYNGKLVQFIREKEVENLDERLREEISHRDERVHSEMLQYAVDSIQSIDDEMAKIDIQIATINKLVTPKTNQDTEETPFFMIREWLRWGEKRANELAEKKLFSLVGEETEEYINRKEELQKERQRCVDIKNWAETPISQSGKSFDVNSLSDSTIRGIRKALFDRKPRIVYVDDMAEEGWADVLRRIIYRNAIHYDRLKTIVPKKNDSIETIVDAICNCDKPELIILDLRLKDERGYYAPATLSGFQVLQELNKKNPSCPIMIFTASNKVWSLKEAFKDNVVSYWTKGELDRSDGMNDGVNNYLDLLCQIGLLTSYKWLFELLADITDTIKQIEDNNKPYWWEEKKLYYTTPNHHYQRKLTNKYQIINLLNSAKQTVQNDMRQMFFFDNSETAKDSMISTFVMRITDILEEIYDYEGTGTDYIRLIERMNAVGIQKVDDYMKTRNKSAHQGYSAQEPKDVVEYVKYVLNYLMTEPDEIVNSPIPYWVSEAKEEPSSDQKGTQVLSKKDTDEGDGLTLVDERKSKLLQGEIIIVEINSVEEAVNKKGEKGYYYYYSIDSKSDAREGAFVPEGRTQYHEGDIIKVKYAGRKPYIFALVSSYCDN